MKTTKQLKKELTSIQKELDKRSKQSQVSKAKKLTINGITAKDICVFYDEIGQPDDSPPYFSFYVKHDGRMYDIYYGSSTYDKDHKRTLHPWWPILPVEAGNDWETDNIHERNGAFDFIPDGFGEAMENCYDYYGSVKEAIACLKKHGIVDVRKGNPHDLGEIGHSEGDGIELS